MLDLKTGKSSTTKPSFASSRLTHVNPEDFAEPRVAIPPDGGWGWVVVAVSFFCFFWLDGVGYCFSIFYDDLAEAFSCDVSKFATVQSLLGGFYYLSGPVICSFINKLGFRPFAILGGVLAFAAYLTASFLNNLVIFSIIIGAIGGTAFALLLAPLTIAIGFYFERLRAVAIAISYCGSAIGMLLFPLIFHKLLEGLDWRNKFRVIAGCFAVSAVLGFTLRPLKTTKVDASVASQSVSQEMYSRGPASFYQRPKSIVYPTISEVSFFRSSRIPSNVSSMDFSVYRTSLDDSTSQYIVPSELIENSGGTTRTGSNTTILINCDETCRIMCRKCCRIFRSSCIHCKSDCLKSGPAPGYDNRPLYRDDIFYTGSVYRLSQYQKTSLVLGASSLAYTISVSRATTPRDLQESRRCVFCSEAFLRAIMTMLDFQMLKSPGFLILMLSGYLSLMTSYVVFMYSPTFAVEKGVDQDIAKMLLSVIGIANLLGRIACGIASFFPAMDLTVVSYTAIIVSGAAILGTVFAQNAIQLILLYILYGLGMAAFSVLRTVMYVEFFGLEKLTNCFGLHMIFQSFAAFSGAPIANFILTVTNRNFEMVFVATSASIILSGIILIPIKMILKWEQKRKKKVTIVG